MPVTQTLGCDVAAYWEEGMEEYSYQWELCIDFFILRSGLEVTRDLND